MIWESHPWKEDLLRLAADLNRRRSQKRWPEASLACVEKNVMLGFYSIRKLSEAQKLRTKTIEETFPITTYPAKGRPVHCMNWHHLEELYDFDRPSAGAINLRDLCNFIIHSYVFSTIFAEDKGLQGILFNSDRTRMKVLNEIDLSIIVDTFKRCGSEYPNMANMSYDPKRADYFGEFV